MASRLRVKKNSSLVCDTSTFAVSMNCQQAPISNHVEGLTNAQWGLLCGFTSPGIINRQGAANRLGVEDQTTGLNSENLSFAHDVPQVAFLAPPLLQEREDPFQLAGHSPPPLHQNSRPYTKTDCSLLTQVPCAPVLVDDSSTLEGVFNLSLHLDPPVNYIPLTTRLTSQTPPEISTHELPPPIHKTSSHGYATFPLFPNCYLGPTPRARPTTHYEPTKGRCYDRPGRKPAVAFEPDPVTLYAKVCKERGGSNFATDWIFTVFKHGVSGDVLLRVLTPEEIISMYFVVGFEPQQAYDGFITKIENHYECGLCREDKKTYWKAKKNAPRHMRKFHFGLADTCELCGKVYTAKAKSGAMPVKPPLLSLIQRTRAMSVQPLGFHICTCLVYL